MGWQAGRRLKREGTYVYLWPIHVDVWQKPTQYCNYIVIILQLKFLRIVFKRVNRFFIPCNF